MEFKTKSLKLVREEIEISLEELSGTLTSEDLATVKIELQALSKALKREAFSLVPDSPLAVTISADNEQRRLSLATKEPLQWTYEADSAQGRANLQLSIDLDSDTNDLSGSAQFLETHSFGYKFKPFTTTFEGNPDSLSFQTTPLFLEDQEASVLSGGDGTLQIPSKERDPIILRFDSILYPKNLAETPQNLAIAPLKFGIRSQIGEESSEHSISLATSDTNSTLLDHGEILATGSVSVELEIREDSKTKTYQPAIDFGASDISLQSPKFSIDGLTATGSIELKELPATYLDSQLDRSVFESLLPSLSFALDWQANEIAVGEDLQARWVGASLTSDGSNSAAFAMNQEIGVGILSIEDYKFEQLHLKQLQAGDLTFSSGETSVSALFEGVSLSAGLQHILSHPFSEYTLNGGYQIEPARFTYSDIVARLVPELQGVSTSATVAANGNFQFDQETADASLILSVEEASIYYPPSRLSADGISGAVKLESLALLDSCDSLTTFTADSLAAGDLMAENAEIAFRLSEGNNLELAHATLEVFSGLVSVEPTSIPLDGAEFHSELLFKGVSLEELSQYIDLFDGELTGRINGSLPFSIVGGVFQPKSGELRLDSAQSSSLSYDATGLLTKEKQGQALEKKTFSDKLLTFLNIEPERIVEDSLADVTIERLDAQLFPQDDPNTPLKITLSGTARTESIEIPVIIDLRVNGTLAELYNFLIRLNSL